MRVAILGLVISVASLSGAVACSSTGVASEEPNGPSAGGAGGTSSAGGAGGSGGSEAAGTGGASAGTGTGGTINLAGSGGSGPVENCQATEVPGTRTPADILIVLDRSGSMEDSGKWPAATGALESMLSTADPELGMGFLRFPEGSTSPCANPLDLICTTDFECTDISDTPNVPVGPLKETKNLIQDAIASTGPNGGTPTLWALRKAYKYMAERETNNDRYVLLVTDGDPTTHTVLPGFGDFAVACGEIPELAKAPTEARKGTPSVRTFVIGAPGVSSSGQEVLSGIAQNGGTCRPGGSASAKTCHYQIGSSNFQDALAKTLEDITASVTNCTYSLPTPSGGAVDPDKVNVVVKSSDGDTKIFKDVSHEDGWDYTDDSKTKVQVYGPQCEAIKAKKEDATVQIGLGCQTEVK